MKRIIPVLLSITLFVSCAARQTEQTAEITQKSVVNTSFDGSFVYRRFAESRTEGPVVPGLTGTLVPQGMAYWQEADVMIISNYSSNGSAGVLSFISMKTGQLEKVLFLYNRDGSPHTGHLGGLAASDRYLWIASGAGVYNIDLQTLDNCKTGDPIGLPDIINTETKASFASISDGILWVGEFTNDNKVYAVAENHHRSDLSGEKFRAWMGGYRLDRATGLPAGRPDERGILLPDYILSIPDEIQGAAFVGNRIFLSASYGHKKNSQLLEFPDPLSNQKPDETVSDFSGYKIPLWFLGESRLKDQMIAPPMSEALAVRNDTLAVLFESGAQKYRNMVLYSLDRIQLIDLKGFEE